MATETTSTSAVAWRPDVSIFAPVDVVPDALILKTSLVGAEIEGDAPSLRVAYVDDAAAQFTAEGTEIPEANPGLSEVQVFTGKITQLIRLSAEQYRQTETAQQLSDSVARAIIKKADLAYLTQVAPTPPAVSPPAGLTNVAGVVAGGEVADSLDVLSDLIATLQAAGAEPSHIVVGPLGWSAITKLKVGADRNDSLVGAGTIAAERRLLSLPVLVTPALTGLSGLVLDRTAIASAAGTVRVAVSEHAFFASDSVAIRADWRIGWNCVRPTRTGKFTIAAGA